MRTGIAATAILAVALLLLPAHAQSLVTVPAGTKVLLRFETPVDSGTATEGDAIKFTVATDVLLAGTLVFKQGAAGQGVVTDVSKPGIFGKNAKVHIAGVQADAVDGKAVRLAPVDVTPDTARQAGDFGAAGATSFTAAILLGPVGLAAGALIRGGNVNLPAGSIGTSSVAQDIQVPAP